MRAASLDHLVGGHEQAGRYGQAECLRSFQVERGFVLGRRLHWKVRWSGAAQDTVDIVGRLSMCGNAVGPIRHQPASRDPETGLVDGRQSVSGGEFDDQVAMQYGRKVRRYEQPSVRRLRK